MNFDSTKRRLYARFDLRSDQAETHEIDHTFRAGVEFRGTNLWVLIFAIFVASVGLNVNSTAVIIGAMLISPLMGPIMALGYGAGINDSALMRSSLFNLGLAVLLSLMASTVYFWLTPLSHAHSELLARTTPTIWDVLIAVFGGLAGAIGVTRRVKSNLIPGVAIATALMPPLCTAGYGLAAGNWQYFSGAIYLFTINCVFIAIATLMIVRLMRLPSLKILAERSVLKRRTVIGIVVILTIIPSVFLAIDLVKKEWFQSNSAQFVRQTFGLNANVLVLSVQADHQSNRIRVSLAGDRLTDSDIEAIRQQLPTFGLHQATLDLQQSGQNLPDMNTVKRDLLNEFMQSSRNVVDAKDARIAVLEKELAMVHKTQEGQLPLQSIHEEIKAQFPNALEIIVSQGLRHHDQKDRPVLWVHIRLPQALGQAETDRLRRGLQARAGIQESDGVRVDVLSASPIKVKSQRPKR